MLVAASVTVFFIIGFEKTPSAFQTTEELFSSLKRFEFTLKKHYNKCQTKRVNIS
jgi:hypothetical protein